MNSTTCTTRNPLAAAYRPLMEAGWEVLPLPYGQKSAPPLGTTGVGGQALTEDQVADYTDITRNIAVRLPEILVGIDVDGYKGGWDTLEENTEKWGELPDNWFAFTSQTLENVFAPQGGLTMFFRIPAGVHLQEGAGKGIDLIQHTHRYAVAPGSLHPDHGGTYRAIQHAAPTADGVRRLIEVPVELLYAPEDAPLLPEAWLEALKLEIPRSFREVAPEPIVLDTTTGACVYMEAILARRLGQLRNVQESRHSLLRDASWAMIQEAGKGHQGADAALTVYLKAWHASFSVVEKKSKRGRYLVQEANSMIANAKAHTNKPAGRCSCGTRKVREELTDWDRKWISQLTPTQRVALRNPHQLVRNLEGEIVNPFAEKPTKEEIAEQRKLAQSAEYQEQKRQEALQALKEAQESTRAREAAKAARRALVVAEAEKKEQERAAAEQRAAKPVRAGLYAPTAEELQAATSTASFTRRSPEAMGKAREKELAPAPRRSRPRTASAMGFSSMRGR